MTFSSQAISRAVPMIQIEVTTDQVGAAYAKIGTFPQAVEMLFIGSTFNQPVILSFDGVDDYLFVPAGGTVPVWMPINFKENRMVLNNAVFWILEYLNTPPTTGVLFISAFSSTIP